MEGWAWSVTTVVACPTESVPAAVGLLVVVYLAGDSGAQAVWG